MLNPIPPRLLSISKSRAIRLLFLALLNNTDVVIRRILAEHRREDLPDDVLRMLDACRFWSNHNIPVGESATVLRFLWWLNESSGARRNLDRSGTLADRMVTLNPDMLNWTIHELLDPARVPEQTSQLASAATLYDPGKYPRIELNCPHHLRITYEVLDEWQNYKAGGVLPVCGIDPTIQAQAEAFLRVLCGQELQFEPLQQEDLPFARAFLGELVVEEARERWPSLAHHESNRFVEMERALSDWDTKHVISSRDHRVIQAVAMRAILKGSKPKKVLGAISHRKAVAKSWPRFEQFIEWAYEQKK
ncbi:MAG: hypothetical protein AAB511_00450 [Patescibacteria group bacterium]